MLTIEQIVNELGIPEKKKAYYERKSIISKIKYSMSQLTLNKMVALYAYNLGVIKTAQDETTRKNATFGTNQK